jgi:hypothetical protein
MAAVHLEQQGADLPALDAETRAIIIEYGQVLMCLKHLVNDIQMQSNIGDELCKDLIHQSFLPMLPTDLWKTFGYEQ